MITEQEYQNWLARNKGLTYRDCTEMLRYSRIWFLANIEDAFTKKNYTLTKYCTDRYIQEELN